MRPSHSCPIFIFVSPVKSAVTVIIAGIITVIFLLRVVALRIMSVSVTEWNVLFNQRNMLLLGNQELFGSKRLI